MNLSGRVRTVKTEISVLSVELRKRALLASPIADSRESTIRDRPASEFLRQSGGSRLSLYRFYTAAGNSAPP